MVLVPHRQGQLDLALVDGHVHALAMVIDRDHVRPLLCHQGEQLDQLARPVVEAAPHDQVAAGRGQPMPHDRDQHGRVDVAAGEDRDRRAFAAGLAGQQRGDTHRARALDHQFRALEQQHDRAADLVVVDRDQVVEHVLEDGARLDADLLDRDPVRNRRPGEPRLHPDDAHVGTHRPQRERDPRREAAPADRDHDRAGLRVPARRARGRSFPGRRSRARPRTDGRTSRRSPPRA